MLRVVKDINMHTFMCMQSIKNSILLYMLNFLPRQKLFLDAIAQ